MSQSIKDFHRKLNNYFILACYLALPSMAIYLRVLFLNLDVTFQESVFYTYFCSYLIKKTRAFLVFLSLLKWITCVHRWSWFSMKSDWELRRTINQIFGKHHKWFIFIIVQRKNIPCIILLKMLPSFGNFA